MTGMTMSIALLGALVGATRTGKGRDVDVCLFDVALHQLSYPATWYLNHGHETTRMPRGAHPATVPAQMYKAKGGWVFVLCMIDKFWQALAQSLGRPDWITDARFNTIPARREHRDLITQMLDEEFSQATPKEWMQRLGGVIPIAPVYNLAQGLDNPYVASIGMIQSLVHAANPALKRLANPIKINGERLPARVAGRMGADTADLLQGLGYAEGEIEALIKQKTVHVG
jgi:crotonobetainyl-CoA:carnitine CoA-transferase CaiB-like acyl-CoA transferase